MPSIKGELPETFPSKLLEDLSQLEARYGPRALHTAIQHRRRAIRGHPRKLSEALVTGVWRLVETVKFLLNVKDTRRVCQLLAKYAIIDEMTETCAFASGTKEFLDTRRKPAERWRRLSVEGVHHLSGDEQNAWREGLRRMPIDPAFQKRLYGLYSALPKRSAGSAGLSDSMIVPRANRS
jgi:hypothetical protein